MDNLNGEMSHMIGVGGLKCPCCNFTLHKGKTKKRLLKKMAKARLKAKFIKELKDLNAE